MVYTDIAIGYTSAVAGIGKQLKALREPVMNQTELGKKLGVGQPAVSGWERNETVPDALQLVRIATALKCSVEDIVDGADTDYDRLRSKRRDLIGHVDRTPSTAAQSHARQGGQSGPAASAPPSFQPVDPRIISTLENVAALVAKAIAQSKGQLLPAEDARARKSQSGLRRRAGGDR